MGLSAARRALGSGFEPPVGAVVDGIMATAAAAAADLLAASSSSSGLEGGVICGCLAVAVGAMDRAVASAPDDVDTEVTDWPFTMGEGNEWKGGRVGGGGDAVEEEEDVDFGRIFLDFLNVCSPDRSEVCLLLAPVAATPPPLFPPLLAPPPLGLPSLPSGALRLLLFRLRPLWFLVLTWLFPAAAPAAAAMACCC